MKFPWKLFPRKLIFPWKYFRGIKLYEKSTPGHPAPNSNFETVMADEYLRGANQLDDHVIHLLFATNRWEKSQELVQTLVPFIFKGYLHITTESCCTTLCDQIMCNQLYPLLLSVVHCCMTQFHCLCKWTFNQSLMDALPCVVRQLKLNSRIVQSLLKVNVHMSIRSMKRNL
jgi:hypothetical protein